MGLSRAAPIPSLVVLLVDQEVVDILWGRRSVILAVVALIVGFFINVLAQRIARVCITVLDGRRTLRRALVSRLNWSILRARVGRADVSRNNRRVSSGIVFGRFWRWTACLLTTISRLNHVYLAVEELLLLWCPLSRTFLLVVGLDLRLAECKVLFRLTLGRWWVLLTILGYTSTLARRLYVFLRGLGLRRGNLGLDLLERIAWTKRHVVVWMIFSLLY